MSSLFPSGHLCAVFIAHLVNADQSSGDHRREPLVYGHLSSELNEHTTGIPNVPHLSSASVFAILCLRSVVGNACGIAPSI